MVIRDYKTLLLLVLIRLIKRCISLSYIRGGVGGRAFNLISLSLYCIFSPIFLLVSMFWATFAFV